VLEAARAIENNNIGAVVVQLLKLMQEHDEGHREELRKLRERIISRRNPFLKIRARGILFWFIFGLPFLYRFFAPILMGARPDGVE
jgi:hypothetical protein